MAIAQSGGNIQGVGVRPSSACLGLRNCKSTWNERASVEIELADHRRVGAAARKLEEAASVVGRKRVAGMPDPVLILGAAKRVDVDEVRPLRRLRAVGFHRGSPPQAARIVLVLP